MDLEIYFVDYIIPDNNGNKVSVGDIYLGKENAEAWYETVKADAEVEYASMSVAELASDFEIHRGNVIHMYNKREVEV